MLENVARAVVDTLRADGLPAHLTETEVYQFGIRVELGDGREAIWGADGTAGLAAEVLLDGDLVGFVPEIAGSSDFDANAIVTAIRRADYSTPVGQQRAGDPPSAAPLPVEGGLFRRFRDGFRYRNGPYAG